MRQDIGSPAYLETLPLELLVGIYDLLPFADRLSLATTNSHFRNTLGPQLFQAIKITSNTRGERDFERLVTTFGSSTTYLHFVASMPHGSPEPGDDPESGGSAESAEAGEVTQCFITELARDTLSGKSLPNVTTVCLSFDFDFEFIGEKGDEENIWDDPNSIIDDSSSIYVFTDEEANDDVPRKEAKYPWHTPMPRRGLPFSNMMF